MKNSLVGGSDGMRGNRGVVDEPVLEWCHMS